MSSRWKMERMGFVNFWLYDEEIFTFEDGKLLLRGQNGSGKSITTQSFIPFILDGDRTPSRLDPFGSSDRKMEFYFLGEEGREEATGYLFLEFFKPETGQYRTIGIGQRAKRGTAMTFWGFVLLDGRRIGYDLQLYKEVGSTRLPYPKQDLKKILGPDVPFTDSPGEYKAMVNRYIFGFRRMEQYDQFIRLLVKIRAPKLSKEFRPTKVYEILNESLQTLTDEELRAMVDAMEKMDAIQNSLDHLKAAQKDAQIIQNEATRYDQFMLGRKARAYLDANAKAEELKVQLDTEEEKLEQLAQEEEEKSRGQEQALQRKGLVDAELKGLQDTDLDAVTERLMEERERREKLQADKARWDAQAEEAREHLLETDRKLKEYEGEAAYHRDQIQEEQKELEEIQDILQYEGHSQITQKIRQEETDGTEEISRKLRLWRQKILDGLQLLEEQEELERQYDQAAKESARCLAQTIKREARLEELKVQEEKSRDGWTQRCFELPKKNKELRPERGLLEELEAAIAAYEGPQDRGPITKKWEQCAAGQRKVLQGLQNQKLQEQEKLRTELEEKLTALEELKARKDWAPERSEERTASRQALTEAGIPWIPFYQAVEFAPGLGEEEQDLLEGQLKEAGFLDALVVERRYWERIWKEFPEYADILICAPVRREGDFYENLCPSGELSPGLLEETGYILRAIAGSAPGPATRGVAGYVLGSGAGEGAGYALGAEAGSETGRVQGSAVERAAAGIWKEGAKDGAAGLLLSQDGSFKNGILEGRSLGGEEASLIGYLARKRRLERQIRQLTQETLSLAEQVEKTGKELEQLAARLETLEQELAQVPDGGSLDAILEQERECLWYLEQEKRELEQAKKQEDGLKLKKDSCLQKVIRMGRELPYARTCGAYREAETAAGEYLDSWMTVCTRLFGLHHAKGLIESEREKGEQYEENQEIALREALDKAKELEVCQVKIRQAEAFLARPENRQLAERLKTLREDKKGLEGLLQEYGQRLAVIKSQRELGGERIREKKEDLTRAIEKETRLRRYFEEELDLKLLMEREDRSLKACAEKAWGFVREADRNRESGALTESLHQVYHKFSGNLLGYGIAMEDCFPEGAADGQSLRKRQRIFSVWNGKKLYLAQFCQALKSAVEETELLILEKDREIFVDILSRTLSQQLTERIEESRQWIRSMSALMKNMDTSMGLSFSLEWKARTAQGDEEIDTLELEKLLRRDQSLLTSEDVERVARHFRSKIRAEKLKLEENGSMINYIDMVRDALDYRKWFEFQMFYYRNQEGKKPLTNAAFNKFSGGEKAMAMYVPLFAAVNAQYQKSAKEDHPRMIALDEAFAGVDDKNISSMFQLVETLDLDYIMNSQAIWGCYETVPALKISELYRPADARMVTVIHYTWNGHERVLDEQ